MDILGSSPGKLKHNLNINVGALLPGAAPPRKQSFVKSGSLDSSEEGNTPNVLSSAEVQVQNVENPLEKGLTKSVSFEDTPVEPNEILLSAAKVSDKKCYPAVLFICWVIGTC